MKNWSPVAALRDTLGDLGKPLTLSEPRRQDWLQSRLGFVMLRNVSPSKGVNKKHWSAWRRYEERSDVETFTLTTKLLRAITRAYC